MQAANVRDWNDFRNRGSLVVMPSIGTPRLLLIWNIAVELQWRAKTKG
jgi:hypothetical protein